MRWLLSLILSAGRFYHWMKSNWPRALLAVPILVLMTGIWQGWHWHRFINTPLIQSGYATVIVPPHSTIRQLAAQLQQRGLTNHPKFLVMLAQQQGYAHKLRVGEYALDPQITPGILLQNIASSKVVMRKLTLVEGTTLQQVRQLLASNDALQQVTTKLTEQEMMARLGHPGKFAEGRFFPDTYFYTWGNKDTVILQQAYQRMAALLAQEWSQRAANLPYKTPDEALIVASLVESEAKLLSERPIIAGVILQRLRKNMHLQIDSTVVYGAGKPYGSAITLADLRNDNPYNTYLYKGLPPTAINMPGAASVYAALHPAKGDALYYVAQGDGSHHFSANYTEHLQAVKKYRQYKKYEQDKQTWYGLSLFIVRAVGLY